jgi:hypothetical protein
LRRAVDAHVGVDATFEQREQLALALANDATRQFLQDDLEAIAERHGAVAPPRRPVSRSSSSARTGAASDGVPMVSMPC